MGAHAGANRARLGRLKGSRRIVAWGVTASLLGSPLISIVSALCSPAEAQGSPSKRRYIAPVDGPIVRRYEEPAGPYAAGHRGIDYGVPAGTGVRASNSGTVLFAGPVANDGLFVTLRHADDLETTYSYLARIDVAAGEQVNRGQQIGLSGGGHPQEEVEGLHFAVKQNGEYIDPESVLEGESDDISDALALVPVEPHPEPERNHNHSSSYQGGYFGGPPGSGSGFTTSPEGAGGAPHRAGGQSGSDKRSANDTRGSGRSRRSGNMDFRSSRGFSSDGSRNGLWARSRDRIGEFLAGEERSRSSMRGTQKAEGTRNATKRSKNRAGTSTRPGPTASSEASTVWGTFGSFMSRRADAVHDWSVHQMDRLTSFTVSRWRTFKLWLAKQTDRIGDFLQPPPDWGLEAFMPGLASGFFHQIGCSLRGGDPPPKMPTAEQFRKGEAKPPPAPNDNAVVVIGGLGSSSTERNGKVKGNASLFDLDFRTLGFKEEQIYHFSYKGIEKRAGGSDPYRIHAAYEKEDTYRSLKASAERLDEQVKEIHRQNPNKQIDLVAHSEGGLVASYFLSYVYDKSDSKQPRVGHLVTLNAPHQGADLARLGEVFTDTATGRLVRWPVEAAFTRLASAPPATAVVLGQIEEDSTFIEHLKKNHDPKKVKTTTIGTAMDWVVTAPHTSLPGADHYTADLEGLTFQNIFKAHSESATAPSTRGLIYNALADKRSQCTAFRNSFAQYFAGPAISTVQDGAIHAAQGQFYLMDASATMGGSTVRPAAKAVKR